MHSITCQTCLKAELQPAGQNTEDISIRKGKRSEMLLFKQEVSHQKKIPRKLTSKKTPMPELPALLPHKIVTWIKYFQEERWHLVPSTLLAYA